MIKFWKSSAKGKSRFPVRPPEEQNKKNHVDLDDLTESEDLPVDYSKESRLSPKLYTFLLDKNYTKYFAQYMQSIGKLIVLKCWLELEYFKSSLSSRNTSDDSLNNEDKSSNIMCIEKNSLTKTNSTTGDKPDIIRSDYFYNCDNLLDFNIEKEINLVRSDTDSLSDPTEKALSLFKKYIALEAPNQLDLSDEVRKTVISSICDPEGQISETCFIPVQDILFDEINKKYFDDFLKTHFYIRSQIDIITSRTLQLSDILYNDTILFYFMEFLEQEHCSILLECLMALTNFRDNLICNDNINTSQAQEDAIIIYEKYFSLQATNPINFPTDVRLNVESEICRDGGTNHMCFDRPYRIVFYSLCRLVRSFLGSELYFKYLTEMISSVDKSMAHRRSQSDCSSEYSISTQNTLLAMGDSSRSRNHSVPDMTIDNNQLYNADSLWQRRKQEGLILGRVNSLGRFESKFEPDPDKNQKSVFKKMVNRFVPTNKKVEEEMAWQIAHMIVKDVTDLTMAPPEAATGPS